MIDQMSHCDLGSWQGRSSAGQWAHEEQGQKRKGGEVEHQLCLCTHQRGPPMKSDMWEALCRSTCVHIEARIQSRVSSLVTFHLSFWDRVSLGLNLSSSIQLFHGPTSLMDSPFATSPIPWFQVHTSVLEVFTWILGINHNARKAIYWLRYIPQSRKFFFS